MARGESKTRELLEGIAAVAAGSGIDVYHAMQEIQVEPLEAIRRLAVVHENLGWIQREINQVATIWQQQGQPDIYATAGWQQGTFI